MNIYEIVSISNALNVSNDPLVIEINRLICDAAKQYELDICFIYKNRARDNRMKRICKYYQNLGYKTYINEAYKYIDVGWEHKVDDLDKISLKISHL